MDRFVNHDDFIEALGAFALDAVGSEEAEAIRMHLEECPRCTEEVAQHHQVAALLGNAGGEAPAHLWDEIAEKIGKVRPTAEPRTALSSVGPSTSTARRSRSFGGIRDATRRPLVLAVAAAVVVIALLSVQIVRLNDRVGSLDARNASAGLNHLAQVALANPSAQKVNLNSVHAAGFTDAELVVLPSGAAYLVNKALPALPSDETYQLWGRSETQLISLGVLGSRPTTVAFTVGRSARYRAYLVTAEPAGGVAKTTHSPVAMSASLST